jgi:small-conductance mechanosensitive channel
MQAPPVADLDTWVRGLLQPTALAELAVLAGCLLLAWVVVRVWRGQVPKPRSIWFGAQVVDGVLFPALALAAAFVARELLAAHLPIAVFRLAVPILTSLLIIRVVVRVLRAAFPASPFVRASERTLSWLVWIGLVLWVTGLLPLVLAELESIHWKVGGVDVSLRSLIEGVLSVVAVMLAALWLSAALEARLLQGVGEAGFRGNLSMRKIAANATRALLLLVGMLIALSAAGIPLGALSVMGGAVGVGIGLGLQKLAANYVSGFVILAENSLRIGDMVKVDNFEGRISDISTRYTVIRALNGRESIVPNEMMITQRVENASLADTRVAVSTAVQVGYGTDLDALMPQLVDAVRGVPRVLAEPGPGVQLAAFGANGLDLSVSFWIDDPHNGDGGVRGAVNLAILRTLTALKVDIPYPQQVVHEAVRPPAG